MPSYAKPGVFVEEVRFRNPAIAGIGTGTTAFVGLTRKGPVAKAPKPLTRFAEFEKIYGGLADLSLADSSGAHTNYVAHAAAAFFAEGGRRLYVARVAVASGRRKRVPRARAWVDALQRVAGIEDVSVVAAPGYTEYASVAAGIRAALIDHVNKARAYRFAVLDVPKGMSPAQARDYKAAIDTRYAAIYTPWVAVRNPVSGAKVPELFLPPSGFVAGIYARCDAERGVWKAPANEIVHSALRLEAAIGTIEQERLNAAGVNGLRFFPGRGNRVWGARTTSSDPEWKYVNVSRYLLYLEQSIDRGTQWAAFEPNCDRLWAAVREAIENFLHREWTNGALVGSKADQAFFVKCDRSTMTQDDLDRGRLVCVVGVAVVKPAEFVLLRIGQNTAGPCP